MTKAERVREYFRDHPSASYDEVIAALDIPNVKVYVHKDIKAGRAVKNEDGSLDYSSYFLSNEEKLDFIEWKDEVRRELIDQLLEANRRETASDQIRLNAKEINKLLNEVRR